MNKAAAVASRFRDGGGFAALYYHVSILTV